MTSNRDTISRRIRALRAKTVENGCTEAEAIAAAAMLADLLAKYNMTLDEAELRASPFTRHTEEHSDWVGERLWKIADAVGYLTGAQYWTSQPGVRPISINFFGFAHEVEIATYLLEIAANAMRTEHGLTLRAVRLLTPERQRRHILPFLDGMADRLRTRIRALKPDAPTGTGLMVLRSELVRQAMDDAGLKTRTRAGRLSRDREDAYVSGVAAGDRVALNPGLRDGAAEPGRLLR